MISDYVPAYPKYSSQSQVTPIFSKNSYKNKERKWEFQIYVLFIYKYVIYSERENSEHSEAVQVYYLELQLDQIHISS